MKKIHSLLLAGAMTMLAATSSTAADDSLYQGLGGNDGINKITEYVTANLLADDRVKHTFDQSDMDRFKKMFAEQMCLLSGGPCKYEGQTMTDVHKGLHLNNADFNAVVEDLQDAMDKAGVPFWTQNRLLAILAPMQRDVVTR